MEHHSADGARDQFAAAHRAPTAARDLNATIADDQLYALLGGDGDTDDDNGPAGGAGPAGETHCSRRRNGAGCLPRFVLVGIEYRLFVFQYRLFIFNLLTKDWSVLVSIG